MMTITIVLCRLKNAFWRLLVDVILGIVAMAWLTRNGRSAFLAESAMNWAQVCLTQSP
jgi:hypothetical protein